MDADLIITPEARQDLLDAYAWYEARRAGTGEEFLLKIDASILAIRRAPEMHAISFGNYRRALIRKFPYAMIYEFEEGRVIVYGVFHTSRDRGDWQRRLP